MNCFANFTSLLGLVFVFRFLFFILPLKAQLTQDKSVVIIDIYFSENQTKQFKLMWIINLIPLLQHTMQNQ